MSYHSAQLYLAIGRLVRRPGVPMVAGALDCLTLSAGPSPEYCITAVDEQVRAILAARLQALLERAFPREHECWTLDLSEANQVLEVAFGESSGSDTGRGRDRCRTRRTHLD
jgi:hypothetical protein